MERLRTAARHLLGLVQDVLDLSRLDADAAPPSRRSAGWATSSRPCSRSWSPGASTGLEMVEDLRTQAEGLSHWGDEARVRQILVNLLAKAVKWAEPRDGAPPRVKTSAGASTQPAAGVATPPAARAWGPTISRRLALQMSGEISVVLGRH